MKLRLWIPLALLSYAACSSSSGDSEQVGSGGGGVAGWTASGGSTSHDGTGGRLGSGGAGNIGGSPGSGGHSNGSDGGANTGGGSAKGGGSAAGGGGGGTGGQSAPGTGGTTGPDAGATEGGARDSGTPGTGGSAVDGGTFDPCPATGACKILPLGDSITWGIGYDGSYRVKLFANTVTDQKNITYVGNLSNGPATAGGQPFPKANEGHSGWTISQIDGIVAGTSSESGYAGKHIILDLKPNIILLHIGTNDMSSASSGAPTRLGALIDKIVTDAPTALLVVSSIIPFPSAASAVTTYNAAVPGVVQTRATAGKHVMYVDQFKDFPTSELGDGVHPNQTGYERMAGVWYAAIQSYLH